MIPTGHPTETEPTESSLSRFVGLAERVSQNQRKFRNLTSDYTESCRILYWEFFRWNKHLLLPGDATFSSKAFDPWLWLSPTASVRVVFIRNGALSFNNRMFHQKSLKKIVAVQLFSILYHFVIFFLHRYLFIYEFFLPPDSVSPKELSMTAAAWNRKSLRFSRKTTVLEPLGPMISWRCDFFFQKNHRVFPNFRLSTNRKTTERPLFRYTSTCLIVFRVYLSTLIRSRRSPSWAQRRPKLRTVPLYPLDPSFRKFHGVFF